MDMKKLSKFLVKAKINTYASGEEEILLDGGKELEFEEKEFRYRDRYFGFNSFIGEEVVWREKEVIWGMNYYGEVLSEIASAKQIYQFLREALKRVEEDKPFRGPDSFREGDFKYINRTEGEIKKFKGKEMIFYREKLVYKLSYHGGLIKKFT